MISIGNPASVKNVIDIIKDIEEEE